MQEQKLKNKNFIDAWKKAFSGIWYAVKTQTNLKIQLLIAIVVISCAIYFKLNVTECMSFAIMLVIITEVINTAIEETVNLCTDKFHPLAKIAKDVSAGAVVLAALNAVIIAIFIVISNVIK